MQFGEGGEGVKEVRGIQTKGTICDPITLQCINDYF